LGLAGTLSGSDRKPKVRMSILPKHDMDSSITGVRGVDRAPHSAHRILDERYQQGEVIAEKYVLVRLLDRGGMGTVWVAHNTVLDVNVGIKLISLLGQHDPEDLAQRLLDEARSAARLDHAAIVRVNDFGQTRFGDPFLAMELLEGEDLGDLLEREQRLPAIQAVQLLLPIAHALAVAHEKNIVHRDVKPENIFLAKDPEVALQPKLLDFGIARMVDSPSRLTIEGSLLGTPDYMSPEQARGELVGAAGDQWSLCIVLYELISGTAPFEAKNYNALLREIIENEPRPFTEYGVGDETVWWIVAQGLNKDPGQRWSSMRELGERLARWLADQGIAEDITGTSLQRTWFRNPEQNSWTDISQLTTVPSELRKSGGSSAGARPHGGRLGTGDRRVTMGLRSSDTQGALISAPSEPELVALAELGRDVDPVALWTRIEMRRHLRFALLFVAAVVAVAVSILISADIIRP
jgi:serine/threonine-protein kinase